MDFSLAVTDLLLFHRQWTFKMHAFSVFLFFAMFFSLGCETPEISVSEVSGEDSPKTQNKESEQIKLAKNQSVDIESMQADIKTLCLAPVQGNFDALIDLGHPFFSEMLGGQDKARDFMKELVKTTQSTGLEVVSVDFPTGHKIVGEHEQFVIVPFTIVVRMNGVSLEGNGSYIGERFSDGKWRYIDASKIPELEKAVNRKPLPEFPQDYKFMPTEFKEIDPNN